MLAYSHYYWEIFIFAYLFHTGRSYSQYHFSFVFSALKTIRRHSINCNCPKWVATKLGLLKTFCNIQVGLAYVIFLQFNHERSVIALTFSYAHLKQYKLSLTFLQSHWLLQLYVSEHRLQNELYITLDFQDFELFQRNPAISSMKLESRCN